eukprot:1289116-Amphidinium_carterae.2
MERMHDRCDSATDERATKQCCEGYVQSMLASLLLDMLAMQRSLLHNFVCFAGVQRSVVASECFLESVQVMMRLSSNSGAAANSSLQLGSLLNDELAH